ncbi:MAG: hypothetical protein R6X25_07070 [Candidatus Krumholzibacteriia bacterium]
MGFGMGYLAGDWYEEVGAGIDYHAQLRQSVGARTHLTFVFRRQQGDRADAGEWGGDVSLKLDEYLFLLGFHGNKGGRARHLSYLELGVGIVDHDRTLDDMPYGTRRAGSARVLPALQGGFIFPVGASAPLVEVGFHLIMKPGFLDDDELGGLAVGAHVALQAALGG